MSLRSCVVALAIVGSTASAQNSSLAPHDTGAVTIHAAMLIDGRGRFQRDALVTVRRGRIERVESAVGARGRGATYDLGDATLLPGFIDAHVHPGWYINSQGALHNGRDGDTPAQSALSRAGNLYATVMAGFTTIQSVGGVEDLDLRDAVNRWQIPGPRILTSITQISNRNLTPDSLRGIVRAATIAGCTEIDHGTFATDAELRLMAEHGTIFDPQVCLVFQNYIDHREVYAKSGYTDSTFDSMAKAIPAAGEMFKRAIATPGLTVIFGTDAVALAHGRNAEELICRVRAGQKPMDVLTSATSTTAKALGLDSLGVLAPGFTADIIAVKGDPSKDIGATRNVVFVMRSGVVFR